MPTTLRPTDPPVSYNFKVTLAPSTTTSSSMLVSAALASLDSDAAFTQISGLGVQLNVKQVRSGGSNTQVYHLPNGVSPGSLTLKRGLATITSPLLLWCFLGGSVGGRIGMWVFKHKTSKRSFLWKLYGIILFQILIGLALYYFETIHVY